MHVSVHKLQIHTLCYSSIVINITKSAQHRTSLVPTEEGPYKYLSQE